MPGISLPHPVVRRPEPYVGVAALQRDLRERVEGKSGSIRAAAAPTAPMPRTTGRCRSAWWCRTRSRPAPRRSRSAKPLFGVLLAAGAGRFALTGLYEVIGGAKILESVSGWIGVPVVVFALYGGLALLLEDGAQRTVRRQL
jgi:hypothetical protein